LEGRFAWEYTDTGDAVPLRAPRRGGIEGGNNVIILGLLLLIIGFLFKISILWTLGIIVLIIGAVLWVLGSTGRAVGGRRHYW